MNPAAPLPAAELIRQHRSALQSGRAELLQNYAAKPNPLKLLHGMAKLVDQQLRLIWQQSAMPDDLALLAVGGYGRGELYPASDVDLLILLPPQQQQQHREVLEQLIGTLWDIGLDLGHSVRSIDECIEEGQRDITVLTALLEARSLCGNRQLYSDFNTTLNKAIDARSFYKAKRLEQEERYAKHNDTPYSLEPNCKESPGGLRDLQIILWLARASGLGSHWHSLGQSGLISAAEARQLARSEDNLRRVRIGLHLLSCRREDRLLFDHQEALARALGYQARASRRASEILMQHYFRNAKRVTQLNTLVLLDFSSRFEPQAAAHGTPLDQHFLEINSRLDIRNDEVFERHPAALLECFLHLSRRSALKSMTPRALRALWRAHKRINAEFRADRGNQANFIELFKCEQGLTRQLRLMNRFGILGAYLPAFHRIVGRMQHDLFHVYTVDQHILQVVRNLRRMTRPEFAHELPFCSRLITAFPGRWRLYLAALFHDIAKGRGGDHSKLGVQDARRFCHSHRLAAADSDLICFLVEHHLTMSHVAQKEDLADADVIQRFAALVQTPERLSALYLLTVCDIRGTSPKVWNQWKAKLLEELFLLTRKVLKGEFSPQIGSIEERQEEARRLLRLRGLQAGTETDFWRLLDTAYFLRTISEEIAWHTLHLHAHTASTTPIVHSRLNRCDEGLQVMVYTRDMAELFARLCGFFARLSYSIVDAKIHTTYHGYALDSFVLLDTDNRRNYRDMMALINHELSEHLRLLPPLTTPPQNRISRKVRHVPLTPEVAFRADDNRRHYVLSISAADRSGLLYDIARVLDQHSIRLHTARITTLGERVEDNFLVSGKGLDKAANLVRLEQQLLETLQI